MNVNTTPMSSLQELRHNSKMLIFLQNRLSLVWTQPRLHNLSCRQIVSNLSTVSDPNRLKMELKADRQTSRVKFRLCRCQAQTLAIPISNKRTIIGSLTLCSMFSKLRSEVQNQGTKIDNLDWIRVGQPAAILRFNGSRREVQGAKKSKEICHIKIISRRWKELLRRVWVSLQNLKSKSCKITRVTLVGLAWFKTVL